MPKIACVIFTNIVFVLTEEGVFVSGVDGRCANLAQV